MLVGKVRSHCGCQTSPYLKICHNVACQYYKKMYKTALAFDKKDEMPSSLNRSITRLLHFTLKKFIYYFIFMVMYLGVFYPL